MDSQKNLMPKKGSASPGNRCLAECLLPDRVSTNRICLPAFLLSFAQVSPGNLYRRFINGRIVFQPGGRTAKYPHPGTYETDDRRSEGQYSSSLGPPGNNYLILQYSGKMKQRNLNDLPVL